AAGLTVLRHAAAACSRGPRKRRADLDRARGIRDRGRRRGPRAATPGSRAPAGADRRAAGPGASLSIGGRRRRCGRRVAVVERRGCDLNPIDATSEEGSLTLRSFIWADQLQRFRLLEGAIEVARRVPAQVERIDAVSFLERELAAPRPDVATVVYHSVFMQ